jgi:quinol monooxygenase YgiN
LIIIHALFKVNPIFRMAFLEQTKQVVEKSQAEEGNISYLVYEDVEERNTFLFLEKWKDQAAIDTHCETAHFHHFVDSIPELLLEPYQAEVFEVSEKINDNE